MKKTLKNVGVLFCTSALVALFYPQIGSGISVAEAMEMPNSVGNAEVNNSNGDDKTRAKTTAASASSAKSSAAAKTETSDLKADSATGEILDSAASSYHATAYALRGRTATGSGVRRGIIAADPRVLPLGTKVRLSAGSWSGNYTVADTGGRIRGRKIDVWVPNNSEARQFGRRKVKLTVLQKAR